ncbi:MAG: hypothetical protein KIT14_23710 [bacterium]|nr:hypothetical protein [bacterium]
MPSTPERLRAALLALPLTVDSATAAFAAVAVPSYGDARPSTIVTLAGDGAAGRGEHVGWTTAAHAAFAEDGVRAAPHGRWAVGAWARVLRERVADPYDRAALEAAAIDLALHQNATSLRALAGCDAASVRYVVSFARTPDPAAAARREGDVELKVDADPAWDTATFAALAAAGRVAILDWKDTGTAADHVRAHAALPGVLVEDPAWTAAPWPATLAARVVADGPLRTAADLDALPLRPAAVNVKPGRMGGWLAALELAGRCAAAGIPVYVGGMFEVGVGRDQLRALAAVLAPDGPNDVAPIPRPGDVPERPTRLPLPPPGRGLAG